MAKEGNIKYGSPIITLFLDDISSSLAHAQLTGPSLHATQLVDVNLSSPALPRYRKKNKNDSKKLSDFFLSLLAVQDIFDLIEYH